MSTTSRARVVSAGDGASQIEITERSPADPDAAGLLRAFYCEQVGRYGFADPAELSVGDFVAPQGVFAIVYYNGGPAGCGGYRWFDRVTRTVEIKKTYVVPAWRGLGGGRALLAWLERHAIAAGARQAILETGVHNTAAIGLFTSAGYRPAEPYVNGRDPEINRAFTRPLTSPA